MERFQRKMSTQHGSAAAQVRDTILAAATQRKSVQIEEEKPNGSLVHPVSQTWAMADISGQTLSPLISPIQKMVLYEAKDKMYLIGSNNGQTSFRVLHFDRSDHELLVVDDRVRYSADEIHRFVKKINPDGACEKLSCFGLVGLVRFLEGYYMVLITRRKQVAAIGQHAVYKIEETVMKYLPAKAPSHPDEPRYAKMFTNVDLRSNFYFSYSYDLTHTLQFHLAPLYPQVENVPVWDVLAASDEPRSMASDLPRPRFKFSNGTPPPFEHHAPVRNKVLAGRLRPNDKFVWNSYLLEPLKGSVEPDWLLYITHGFVGQANISFYGRPLYLTLIARRSREYAGPRYLKRGANFEGFVANEVETEQILYDSSISSFEHGLFSSYVQMRGSVPAHWSQEFVKYVPKPQINVNIFDPYYAVAGMHFNQVLQRYGSPVMILNLVKKKEKKKHESLLRDEMQLATDYLSQFLPEANQLEHIPFDMARQNKKKEGNVMSKLAVIAQYTLKRNGIFLTAKCNPRKDLKAIGGVTLKDGRRHQTGVTRVNCVDCLDRTNTAQFALGRCALGYQLYALGVIAEPKVDFDTDCAQKLEELYENHGDIIALQYGGSQLVHRVKTYRKIAPITSQSRDIYMTLSRYYNNNFSDREKQDAMDVFLGIYRCEDGARNLWDLGTDYYLHNSLPAGRVPCHRPPYSMWYDEEVLLSLPFALETTHKHRAVSDVCLLPAHDERVDTFQDQYRSHELNVLEDVYSVNLETTKDPDPFAVRIRGRPTEEHTSQNPSLAGDSTASTLKNEKEDDDDKDDDDQDTDSDDFDNFIAQRADAVLLSSQEHREKVAQQQAAIVRPEPFTFEKVFLSMKETYGAEISHPSIRSTTVYQRYADMDNFNDNFASSFRGTDDSVYSVKAPWVGTESARIYENYIGAPKTTIGLAISEKRSFYQTHVSMCQFY
ncbi:polyphosphoinositide phosphatase-like [Tropilaelaps mercedesae]|uniref:Polyphosphoinositide phosphatase-like n=1 Tax=Tropilaelaps mercedesae TaxID=418985 RepID=A0A1V9XQB8_9ACAR|nr:polyphosphoinositide phosphatase-like [Tropilaelaps mercedesae]